VITKPHLHAKIQPLLKEFYMLISDKKKVIFVHIQKTAGTSVSEVLRSEINDTRSFLRVHDFAVNAKKELGNQWDDYYKFAFVRNPWDRFVSWYSMITNPKNNSGSNDLWEYVRQNSSNFKEFIKQCTNPPRDHEGIKKLGVNQLDYITDSDGKIIVDYVGRFENFEKDFKTVLDRLDIKNVEIPHIRHNSSHGNYREYYDDETRQIIEDRFKKDIEYFGYQF